MFGQRHWVGVWALTAAAALTTPATTHAQFLFFPFGGNMFGSPVSGTPFGGWWGGYNRAPYGSTNGFYPYSAMSAAQQTVYTTVPAYQPLYNYNPYANPYSGSYNGYPGATSYLGNYSGIATAGLGPRLRATPLTGLGGSGIAPAGLGQGTGITGRPGIYTTAPFASAGVAPFACATMGCGAWSAASLNYAAATVPPDVTAFNSLNRNRTITPVGSGIRYAGGAGVADNLANTAAVDVTVPSADAEIWVEGVRMNVAGTSRHFVSPPLTPGSRYAYEVRARWEQNGQIYSQSRNIEVRAGNTVRVDFTTP